MAQSVKKTLIKYRQLESCLRERLEELELKQDALQSSLPEEDIIADLGLEEDESRNLRLLELKTQRLKATGILISILEIKLSFVEDMIAKLEPLNQSRPREQTPSDLQVRRFHDWVDSNQQLYDLNTELYEIEKSKWNMKETQRQRPVLTSALTAPSEHSILVTTSVLQLKQSLEMDTSNLSLYVADRLQPRDNRMTLEATKIEEYIVDCHQYQNGSLALPPKDAQGFVRGAHPQNYHAFIEVLCNYIVERHRSSQGEDLPYATIYTAIEHNLIPRIKHYVLKYIQCSEEDKLLHQQCVKYADITLSQLRVPESLRSTELVPFADAIAHMRATYFSQSPTDKMYRVVAAAKALHERLSAIMMDGCIDGDTFLDLWVYVSIKANMKDMATNVSFMMEYGNPQLSLSEAGYYLTTLHAAMSFIRSLTPDKLQKQEENNSHFILCEIEEVKSIVAQNGSCFQLVTDNLKLIGYKVAVIQKWVMDTSRFFSTVLVSTGDPSNIVTVALVRLNSDNSSPQHVEYFYEKLSNQDLPGITCRELHRGFALIADPVQCGDQLLILKGDDTCQELLNLRYAIQLVRLGSEEIEEDDEDPSTHRSLPHITSTSPSYAILSNKLEAQLDGNSEALERAYSLPTNAASKAREKALSRLDRLVEQNGTPKSPSFITVSAEVYGTSFQSDQSRQSDVLTDGYESEGAQQRDVEVASNSTVAPDLLSPAYVDILERNFLENHLYGNRASTVKESMKQLIKQCQMMMQRLGFLSSLHKLDGVFDDITMNSIQSFQVVHNKQDKFFNVQLPETGILTVATYQYLRQELLTIFANLMRVRKDIGFDLLANFNPLSTEPEDIDHFTQVIANLQQNVLFNDCQRGVLCPKTVAHIRQLLRSSTFSGSRIDRGLTL